MAKTNTFLIIACVVALIIGGLLTYWIVPAKVEIQTKEVIKQVPVVEVKEVTKEVPLDARETYLNKAMSEFLKEASKEDDFVYCDGEEYDEEQVKTKSAPKDWGVDFSTDLTIVSFDTELKYLDKDVEVKCYKDYSVEVTYEDGEKPQVSF